MRSKVSESTTFATWDDVTNLDILSCKGDDQSMYDLSLTTKNTQIEILEDDEQTSNYQGLEKNAQYEEIFLTKVQS